MAGRHPRGRDVVDVDDVVVRPRLHRTTAVDHRDRVGDAIDERITGVVRHEQGAVDAAVAHEPGHLVARVVARDEQVEQIVRAAERPRDARHDGGEERVAEEPRRVLRHDEGDGVGLPRRERTRGTVGHVAELLDRRAHRHERLRADRRRPVDHARDRRPGHPGGGRHLFDRRSRHRTPSRPSDACCGRPRRPTRETGERPQRERAAMMRAYSRAESFNVRSWVS